jgi:hypothetical protein
MVVTAKDKQILSQALKALSMCKFPDPTGQEMLTFAVTFQSLDAFIKRVDAHIAVPPAVTTPLNVTPIGKKKK